MNTIDESDVIFKNIEKSAEICRQITPFLQPIIDKDEPALMAVVLASLVASCANGIKGNQSSKEKFANEIFKISKHFLEMYKD